MFTLDPAMIDWTKTAAFAATASAIATVFLGLMTWYLARQARAQVVETRTAAIATRGDAHIIEADPIQASVSSITVSILSATFQVNTIGDRPVFKVTVTLRSDEIPESESQHKDLMAPKDQTTFVFRLAPFLENTTTGLRPIVKRPELLIESYGLLGQRVIQKFTLYLDRYLGNSPRTHFEQTDIEIVPKVDGASSFRQTSIDIG